MKKEIGGYIELESYDDGYSYYNYYDFNSARNAFLFYAKSKRVNKIYIPYFLCDSITNICMQNNIKYCFYHIDKRMRPVLNVDKIKKDELVYIVNYFGFLTNEEIKFYKRKFSNIIVDNVQCFYRKAIKSIPTIYSCRKFFGVPDGGYLSCCPKNPSSLKRHSAANRMKHLVGRKNGLASEYYNDFRVNESFIDSAPVEKMSPESFEILKNINHDFVKEKRNENFRVLHKNLSSINLLKFSAKNAPFCYPLFVENGDELRKFLIKNLIYVPKLWPNVTNKINWEFETILSENLLAIPCDQRYSEEDMKYISRMILKYEKK